MPYKKFDSVQQSTTTTGTGNIVLGAATSALFRSLQTAGMVNGDTTRVRIQHADNLNEWEIVLVQLTGSNNLIRTVDAGFVSPTGALINFSAGTKYISSVVATVDLVGLDSPAFIGNPTAPTPAPGDSDTSLATTAFVMLALSTAIAGFTYAPLNSPAFTGNPTAPTQTIGDNDTSIATTAFVQTALSQYAPLAGPNHTGLVTITNTAAGAVSNMMYLRNNDGTAGTGVGISFNPTTATIGQRDAWIIGKAVAGGNAVSLIFQTSNGAAPGDALVLNPDKSASFLGQQHYVQAGDTRIDSAGVPTFGTWNNYGINAASQGMQFNFNMGTGGALGALAARIRIQSTDTWAAGASQDAQFLFDTALDGVISNAFVADSTAFRIGSTKIQFGGVTASQPMWKRNGTSLQARLADDSADTGITASTLILSGKETTVASAAGGAGFNLPHGTAPSAPVNGDVWTTASGLLARINGATIGPYIDASALSPYLTSATAASTYMPLAGGTFTGDVLIGSTAAAQLVFDITTGNYTGETARIDAAALQSFGTWNNWGVTASNHGISLFFGMGTGGATGGNAGALEMLSTDTWAASGNRSAKIRARVQTGGTGLTNAFEANSSNFTVPGSISQSAPVTVTASTYTVAATDVSIICNNAATVTLTLPSAASFSGREIKVKTVQAFTVVSASSNVIPANSTTAGTAILAATAGKFANLVAIGGNWVIMENNA